MRYLIVNADDFGLTEGVSEGIIEAFQYGIVRSTTMFANTEHFDHAISLLKKNSDLGVGVHLTLTDGEPLSKGASIVNGKGSFYKVAEFGVRLAEMNPEEIEQEFVAQIERIQDAGINVTHLDTHQHIHRTPRINDIVAKLCLKYNLAIRKTDNPCLGVRSTAAFTDKFYNEMATNVNFKMLVKKHERADSMEVMCHPGKSDMELLNVSRYAKKREIELRVLSAYELQAHVESMGIKLIHFGQLD